MRSIGHWHDESQAKHFGDFLCGEGIENQVDQNLQGHWEIWVLDDENLPRAGGLFDQFRRAPGDPRFAAASRTAATRRQQDQKTQIGKRVRMIDGRTIFYSPPVPVGALSVLLILVSVTVAILTDLGQKEHWVQLLSIARYSYGSPPLLEIRQGEIWRLFTPIFLHFGILHLVFNMLWLRDLGSMIEARKGPWTLLLLVLALAGTSNIAQYIVSGPSFGGLSGVVYGLLGYVWMQGRFNPASQLTLQPQTVTLMVVWFFVCLSGFVGPIANTVHAVGFGVGIAWGFLAARLAVALRRG